MAGRRDLIRMTDDELREPFGRWLSQRWPHATDLVVDTFESPKSGFSARTIFVPVRYRADGVQREERVVLRLESSETPIYPQQAPGIDVEIEGRLADSARSVIELQVANGVPLRMAVLYPLLVGKR